jgi:hypothetical protein
MPAVVRWHYFPLTIRVLRHVKCHFSFCDPSWTDVMTSLLLLFDFERLIGVQTTRMMLDSAVTRRKVDCCFEFVLHFQYEESP